MRIEKKSDQSFRCVLTAKELEDRQIRLDELTYGSAKARKLFEDMVWEAEEHYGVYLTGEPLVIEAIPLKNEGIALEFSVAEDPEELDSRYSEFTLTGGSRDTDEDVLGADDLLREQIGDFLEFALRNKEGLSIPPESAENAAEPAKESAKTVQETAESAEEEAKSTAPDETEGEKESGNDLPPLGEAELLDPEEEPDVAEMANSIRGQIEEGLRKLFPNAMVESVDMTTVRVSGTEDMDEFHKKLMKAFADKIRAKETEDRGGDAKGEEGLLSDGFYDDEPLKNEEKRKSGRRGRASHSRQNRENLRLYRFSSLEDVLAGAANVVFFKGESTLFHGRDGYSLVLRQGSSELRDFNRVCNVLSEYGLGRAATPAAVAYLAEHGQCIFRGNAVEQLAKIAG